MGFTREEREEVEEMARRMGNASLSDRVRSIHRDQIVVLAARHRLPALYEFRDFVEAGGLMCYGADMKDVYRHLATYVDRIFKGALPADLPVESPRSSSS